MGPELEERHLETLGGAYLLENIINTEGSNCKDCAQARKEESVHRQSWKKDTWRLLEEPTFWKTSLTLKAQTAKIELRRGKGRIGFLWLTGRAGRKTPGAYLHEHIINIAGSNCKDCAEVRKASSGSQGRAGRKTKIVLR